MFRNHGKKEAKDGFTFHKGDARDIILLSRSHSETLPGAVLSEDIIQESILKVPRDGEVTFTFQVSSFPWIIIGCGFLWACVLIDGPSLI